MDHYQEEPAYPFGFGLSYTSYAYHDLHLEAGEMLQKGMLHARVSVTNTGGIAGEEIVHFYVGYPQSRVGRPVRELKGFIRLH